MFTNRYTEEQLADRRFRKTIPPKWEVYYLLIGNGRAFGYRHTPKCGGRWVARIRVTVGYGYREYNMGLADDEQPADGNKVLTFTQAKEKAINWFNTPEFIPIRVAEERLNLSSQLIVCPVGDKYTVAHAMKDYCQWKKDFTASKSWQAVTSRANVYTIQLLGGIPCDELTPQHCRSLLLHIESSELHRAGGTTLTRIDPSTLSAEARRKRRVTANHTFCDFRKALDMAFGDGKIASNAAWRHVKLFRSTHKARTDILTWEQARRLVDIATPEFKRLILAALYTGCRLGELFRLRVGDVDPYRAALYVLPGKTYRGRTIALPDEGYEFFKTLSEGLGNDSPLIRRNRDWPWNTYYVADHFRIMARKIGLPSGFVFHSLRHTYASLLLRANTPPIIVSRQLGHQNMATTFRMYAHVTDDFMDHEFRNRFKPGFLTSPDLFAVSKSEAELARPRVRPDYTAGSAREDQITQGNSVPQGTILSRLSSLR